MQPHSFEGIFYVKTAPSVRYEEEDGMFSAAYDIGKVRIEFIMRPSVYLAALKRANQAADEFHERKSVVPLKSK